MIIDFHLSLPRFLAFIRERQKWIKKICAPGIFTFQGEDYCLDHLEFPDSVTLENVDSGFIFPSETFSIRWVRFTQPVRAHLVRINDLEANQFNATPATLTPEVDVAFDIRIEGIGGNPEGLQLCVEFVKVDYKGLQGIIPKDVQEGIEQALQITSYTPFDLTPIKALMRLPPGETLQIAHAGVRVDDDGTRYFAIRIQLGQLNGKWWQDFYGGQEIDLLGSDDWSTYLDQSILMPVIKRMWSESLSKSSDFDLSSGVSVTWPKSGTAVKVGVSFSGEVVDACTCGWKEIDVDVDVSATMVLTVPTTDNLRWRVTLDYDGDNLEELCCELTAAAFWPVIGAFLLNKEQVAWWQYLVGLGVWIAGGAPLIFIGAIIEASNQTPLDKVQFPPDCHKESDSTFVCEQPFQGKAQEYGTLTLERAERFGVADAASAFHAGGLRLSGTLDTPPETNTPILKVSVAAEPFKWSIPAHECVSTDNVPQYFEARAVITVTNAGPFPRGPFYDCSVEVLDDPLQIYAPRLDVKTSGTLTASGFTITVVIPLYALDATYLADPYPLKVLIQTNAGARIVTIPAVKPPTSKQKKTAESEWIMAIHLICASKTVPYDEYKHLYKPHQPDPADVLLKDAVLHLWQLVYNAAQVGDMLRITDGSGAGLATVTVKRVGLVQLSAATSGSERSRDLVLMHTLARGGKLINTHATKSILDLRESIALPVAVLGLDSQSVRMVAGRTAEQISVLLIVGDDIITALDISFATRPRALLQLRIPGLKGALVHEGQIFTWGDYGLERLDQERASVHRRPVLYEPQHSAARAVVDVDQRGTSLFILTEDRLTVLDLANGVQAVVPIANARHIGISRHWVILGEHDRLVLFERENLSLVASTPVHIQDLVQMKPEPPLTNSLEDVIYVRTQAGERMLLDLSRPDEPVELAHFESAPWYEDSVRIGRLLAHKQPGSSRALIYVLEPNQQLVSKPKTLPRRSHG